MNEANDKIVNLLKKIEMNKHKLDNIAKYTLGMQVYHNFIHKKIEIENRIYYAKRKINLTYYPETGGANVAPC